MCLIDRPNHKRVDIYLTHIHNTSNPFLSNHQMIFISNHKLTIYYKLINSEQIHNQFMWTDTRTNQPLCEPFLKNNQRKYSQLFYHTFNQFKRAKKYAFTSFAIVVLWSGEPSCVWWTFMCSLVWRTFVCLQRSNHLPMTEKNHKESDHIYIHHEL